MKAVRRLTITLLFILCLAACNKEESAKLTQSICEMYVDEERWISGQNLEGLMFTSTNEFVATTANGKVYSHYVGECYIINQENNLNLKVKVLPKENFLDADCLKKYSTTSWKDPYSTVLDKYGTPAYIDNKYIGYNTGDKDIPSILFRFDYSTQHVDMVGIGVNRNKSSELLSYLRERYASFISYDFDYTFYRYDKKGQPDLLICLNYESNLISVMFMPVSTKSGEISIFPKDIIEILGRK